MTDASIIALRALLLLLAPYCAYLTWRGAKALWNGQLTITQHNQAQVFCYSFAVMIGQIFFLFFPEPAVLLLALLLTATSLGLAITLRHRTSRKGFTDVQAVVDRPDLTLPMVQLAELDEAEAESLASQARQRIAERRMGK